MKKLLKQATPTKKENYKNNKKNVTCVCIVYISVQDQLL